jgi:2-(1,2-epoxy-1,2-dihydrophenyl)acetyl-CoA isomerase
MTSESVAGSHDTPDAGPPTDDVRGLFDEATFVGTIEIHRPPHNYLNGDTLAHVVDLASELEVRGARALLLCSAGKNFCAGADFGGGDAGGRTGAPHLYDIGIKLLEQPLPIVAALQGATVGGGVGLCLVADIRVASPESRFWVNFARIGTHHGFGMTVTLPMAVGPQTAVDLLYSGRRIDGTTARSIGLCDHLVPGEVLRPRALQVAAEIAAAAPLAIRAIRATMRQQVIEGVRAAMTRERAVQEQLAGTVDFAEGTRAVRARRAPRFVGH